ncbi:DUF4382 domain-containing protein [Massilia violaceinigra]|uniref:DUF4382 domain-containing protein n=1 Tax=Massilia violaceinigra TaxID=2045208 RepID=A0ABY4AEA4_9BURK|nr:DUF4382 domain-containing protein [Massilia violaceinigra]UOD33145.1 DUF4382 domain-containing protein [Massilia violaceinigra]
MKSTFIRLGTASTVVAAMALAACGGGGGSPGNNSVTNPGTTPPALGGTSGTLNIALTDAPACGFDAVNVTVSKVRVHQSATAADADTGWSEVVLAPARKINLLNLTNGVLDPLGSVSVPAGRYTQVRLLLDPNTANGFANSVVPSSTKVETTLETPADLKTGVKITSNFEVVAGQPYNLVLDFDACRSVINKAGGGYLLTPSVSAMAAAGSGISGYVSTLVSGSGVVVSAQQNGKVIGNTTVNAATGAFAISRLNPGSYDVVFVGTGRAAAVIGDVSVPGGASNIALGTSASPITMPASLMRSVSGTVSLLPLAPSVKPYVAAMQTVTNGKTVVIQAVDAAAGTGAYTIGSLPLGAPQYATYSATAPLVFSSAAPTQGVGNYRIDAVATGYSVKSVSPVNVSNGDQTSINLQLTP